MPKAKKLVSRKRARSYLTRRRKRIKRVKKLRRVKGKRIWYKKYKGKYSKSKTGRRYKYTMWLDLAQFLSLPYQSFIHPVCQAVIEDKINGMTTTAAFNDSCGQFLGDLLTVCSTADTNPGLKPEASTAARFMHWTAWNPFLCQETLGAQFNELLIKYNLVKYSGVKISWKPNIKWVNTRNLTKFTQDKVVPTSGATHAQMQYNYMEVVDGQSFPGITPADSGRPMRIDVSGHFWSDIEPPKGIQQPIGIPAWDNDYYAGFDAPPGLRLWINFNKQGYEPRDILQEEAVEDNQASSGFNITGSRYMTGRICDNYGQYIKFPMVKSYSLSRPFKFYVRPKVTGAVYEPPQNQGVIRNREDMGSEFQAKVFQTIPDGSVFATGMKPFPYVNIGNLFPYMCPYDQPPSYTNQLNIWLVNNVKQKGFTDPILFGWMLTDDRLPSGTTSCPFTVKDNSAIYPLGSTRTMAFTVENYTYIRNLGRFKVTFYTKWKGNNCYNIPRSLQNALYNAQWGRDTYDPYAMDTEPAQQPEDPKN